MLALVALGGEPLPADAPLHDLLAYGLALHPLSSMYSSALLFSLANFMQSCA